MKSNRICALALAAAILFSIICAACNSHAPSPETAAPETAVAESFTPVPVTPAPTEGAADDLIPVRWQNKGQKPFLPARPIQMIPFPDIKYVRPDLDKLVEDCDSLVSAAKMSNDAGALLAKYFNIEKRIHSYYSMYVLARYYNYMDTTDSYYRDELAYLIENDSLILNLENKMCAALAAAPCRNEMENRYFGVGFLEYYDNISEEEDDNAEWNVLQAREAELLQQYNELTGAPLVTYNGETKLLNEWQASDSVEIRDGAYDAYVEQYHDRIAALYVDITNVRQKLARSYGYSGLLSYYFSYRPYNADLARDFLKLVRTHLTPLVDALYKKNADLRIDYTDSLDADIGPMLTSAARRMGGSIREAERFMTEYRLYDLAPSPNKSRICFTDYLGDYETPFIFINPTECNSVYSVLAHEFGHFTDRFHGYDTFSDYETAEVYSQAMPYLAIAYADGLSDADREENLRMCLVEMLLERISERCCLADFEYRVFKLSEEELTVEKLDEIFAECRKAYGIRDGFSEKNQPGSWVKYIYFFSHPCYVISYPTSALASLQICRLEYETPGAGVAAFERLLDRTSGQRFLEVIGKAGLSNPMYEKCVMDAAEFFKSALDIE